MMKALIRPIATTLLLAGVLLPSDARGDENDSSQPGWSQRKSYFDDHYVIVKHDGTTILATGPYEVKNGRAVFNLLVNYRKGPLSSIPLSELDVQATDKANQIATEVDSLAAPPAKVYPNVPIFGTKEISSALETPEMKAMRAHIKEQRELERQAMMSPPEPAPIVPPKPPATVSPQAIPLIAQGRVQKGMTMAEVSKAWGNADATDKTYFEGDEREVWTYVVKGTAPFALTFSRGKLLQIVHAEQLLYTASLRDTETPR